MQRLYSTFADRWPGVGLVLQRVLVAIMLVRSRVIHLMDSPFSISMIPHIIGASAGMLFLVGRNQVLAGNGQPRDCHRKVEVKRLTLRSRCSAPGR